MRQRSSASRERNRQQDRLRRQNESAQEQRRRLGEQQRRQEALRANESAEVFFGCLFVCRTILLSFFFFSHVEVEKVTIQK